MADLFSMFEDEILDRIPEPLKETTDADHYPAARQPHVYPKDVEVNINVNTKDLPDNKPTDADITDVSSDTITVPRTTEPEWTEPHAESAERSSEAMESFHAVTRLSYDDLAYEVSKLKYLSAPARRVVYNDLHGVIGEESIGSFIINSVVGLQDTILHIVGLFRTALFDGWRDFKRSELTEYYQSNRMTMVRLLNASYFNCSEARAYIPIGMKGRYVKALESLTEFLDVLDMNERTKHMVTVAEKILENIRSNNNPFNMVEDDYKTEFADMNKINLAFNKTTRFFTKSRETETTFGKVFDNMGEFKTVVNTLIDECNSHLQNVATIHSRLKETEEIVGEIVEKIDRKAITRQQLDLLSKIARTWAELFDKYALIINDVYRIDHNVTLDIVDLREHLNI
jgi:hypothetical protein